jgi:outer membrane protein TolC
LPDALRTAFQCRPEINEARNECRAAQVRLGVSEKDLLPVLDFVTESHVNGLNGQNDMWQSFVDQFGRGGPSASFGLIFEMPFGNRAARAANQRRQVELRQLVERLDANVAALSADVEAAVRDVDTALVEIGAKTEWLGAQIAETQYFHRRWELAAGEEQSASTLLRDLLDAQERLAQAEQDVARAQVAHTLAHYRLKQATGTLLQAERVVWGEACEDGVPRISVGQPMPAPPGVETQPQPPPADNQQATSPRAPPDFR